MPYHYLGDVGAGPPVMVAPKGVKEAWGPALDMDSRGRVALAYMASTDSPGRPWTGSYAATTFTGYLGLVTAPLSARPRVVSGRLPGAALAKGACGPGRCNDRVLDFIDVAFARDGSVLGAFVDSTTAKSELVVGRLR